jgi:hypothetical protein
MKNRGATEYYSSCNTAVAVAAAEVLQGVEKGGAMQHVAWN